MNNATATAHTFAGSGSRASEIQRGLDDYDRDTIAYLAMAGLDDILLRRVADSLRAAGVSR